MSENLQRYLRWLGSGLALIGVGFVVIRLNSYWATLDFSRIAFTVWCLFITFTIVYCLANFMLAYAWRCLLLHLGGGVTKSWSINVYGVSQLGKYLPGNLFHFAGRQAMGMVDGLPAGILAKSTVWELGMLVTSGSVFVFLTLPLLISDFSFNIGIALLLFSIFTAIYLLNKVASSNLAWAFVWQVCFLFVSAIIFVSLLCVISSNVPIHLLGAIGGAYIVSWLIGLVTPGAPAGVGIRELILLLLIKNIVVEEDLLLAILLGRLVTVTGDFLFFLSTFFISKGIVESAR